MLHAKFDKLQRELGADVKDLDYSRADLISRLRQVSKRLGVPAVLPSADSARPIAHITVSNPQGKLGPLPENGDDQEADEAPAIPTGGDDEDEPATATAASIVAKVH